MSVAFLALFPHSHSHSEHIILVINLNQVILNLRSRPRRRRSQRADGCRDGAQAVDVDIICKDGACLYHAFVDLAGDVYHLRFAESAVAKVGIVAGTHLVVSGVAVLKEAAALRLVVTWRFCWQ